ncbi:MAG: FliI/YscN family ATPase [Gammaproteobacteria bacterium]|nr:FliI/YscN family ATPase [Gammaproteobacteria bacterium]
MSILKDFTDNLELPGAELFATTRYARVRKSVGLLVEAEGFAIAIGELCWLQNPLGGEIPCEVVGFEHGRAYLMPLATVTGIEPGTLIRAPSKQHQVNLLPEPSRLLGRVVDGLCHPLDGGDELFFTHAVDSTRRSINPMRRLPIDTPLETGVAVIDALNSVGRGQRMGLFAGSGVGKSVLLGMLARFVKADIVVVGLIGERGREVREFVVDNLGEGLARSVVVACPADDSAALRLRGARLATQIAEMFRDEGKHVLLLMDSLTRVAQAQREIGLAMGEPPTSKGYTPSSFACLPRLVERAGTGTSADAGSITGFYTVLAEEDDLQDPIVDAARAILDGHLVLNRNLAERGIYPAIDAGSSISRVMSRLADENQTQAAQTFRKLWQTHREQQDLINIGAYQKGSDAVIDQAIKLHEPMCEFVRQSAHSLVSREDAITQLQNLFTAKNTNNLPQPVNKPN